MPLSAEDRRAAVRDEADLAEMNRLLSEAGKIADRLTHQGYEVVMSLWHETQGSTIVNGRLQANVAKTKLKVREG